MPPTTAEHYRNKIAVFLRWYQVRGYPDGIIPDDGPENAKGHPSWRRICKVLLVMDYYCKRLSFSPTKSEAYTKYKKLMSRRRAEWQLI
jgi:predicted phosphoadenosine phosphosulfate sulfurtransferase